MSSSWVKVIPLMDHLVFFRILIYLFFTFFSEISPSNKGYPTSWILIVEDPDTSDKSPYVISCIYQIVSDTLPFSFIKKKSYHVA